MRSWRRISGKVLSSRLKLPDQKPQRNRFWKPKAAGTERACLVGDACVSSQFGNKMSRDEIAALTQNGEFRAGWGLVVSFHYQPSISGIRQLALGIVYRHNSGKRRTWMVCKSQWLTNRGPFRNTVWTSFSSMAAARAAARGLARLRPSDYDAAVFASLRCSEDWGRGSESNKNPPRTA